MSKGRYVKSESRCKHTLWLFRHTFIHKPSLGWRCKYCNKPFIKVKERR